MTQAETSSTLLTTSECLIAIFFVTHGQRSITAKSRAPKSSLANGPSSAGSETSSSLQPRSVLSLVQSVPSSFNLKYTTNYVGSDTAIKQKVHYTGNNVKSMHISVQASLKKLRTTYIDILYVHWWDWETSIEEVMNGLHTLVQQGKVLYLVRVESMDEISDF